MSKHDSNKNQASSLDKLSQEVELDKRTGKGDGKGEGKDNKVDYTKNIIKPIVKLEDCDFPVEGTIEYLENGVWVAIVDYVNGECDLKDIQEESMDLIYIDPPFFSNRQYK